MSRDADGAPAPLCPSARPEMAVAVVFGVIGGTVDDPRVAYLDGPRAVTDEVRALAGPVEPTEVFRIAAPCAGGACRHFDGASCRLATRTVQLLPIVVDVLPACRIRPECRWWLQEGKAACLRCPQVVTDVYNPTDPVRAAAVPSEPPSRPSS